MFVYIALRDIVASVQQCRELWPIGHKVIKVIRDNSKVAQPVLLRYQAVAIIIHCVIRVHHKYHNGRQGNSQKKCQPDGQIDLHVVKQAAVIPWIRVCQLS